MEEIVTPKEEPEKYERPSKPEPERRESVVKIEAGKAEVSDNKGYFFRVDDTMLFRLFICFL